MSELLKKYPIFFKKIRDDETKLLEKESHPIKFEDVEDALIALQDKVREEVKNKFKLEK